MTIQADATLAPDRTLSPSKHSDAELWERVRARLADDVGAQSYNNWLARLELETIDGGVARLSVPHAFLRKWIQAHFLRSITAAIQAEVEAVGTVALSVRSSLRTRTPAALPALPAPAPSRDEVERRQRARDVPLERELCSPLDARMTFAQFLVADSNRTAHAAALAMAGASSSLANLLFICGPLGAGKSHLLQAIAAEAGTRAAYVTAERFQFYWRDHFYSRDWRRAQPDRLLILFDDAHFLLRGDRSFARTLGALIECRCSVVMSADCAPAELTAFDERTRARITGGLVVQIAAPEEGLRAEILARRIAQARCAQPGFAISDDVARAIAAGTRNGREIEGCVNRLMIHHIANPDAGGATAADAQTVLASLFGTREQPQVNISGIQRVIAREYGVTRGDLLSSRRTANVVRPRQIAMYLAKVMTQRSLPDVGRKFGGRDHTTVLHAVNKISRLVTLARNNKGEGAAVTATNTINRIDEQLPAEIERLRALIVKDAAEGAAAAAF